ncbi:lipoyl(octanoyl) transferase LipB [Pseudoclavibacter sp. VKM Ac-2867]|uniref:lipoyl(octanoyl) transferase LipB n=1 Tax=Pseudoclavibacter sp. VKM Ac-2867 TaxID=2783829 RepID=UPI00188D68BB|nr:lipoyl(octanoyl) transferase LipB [Pseudoclavibacter sp. VKM Ac-2867]MBF4459844.1 lipoyl(octanoyl) transferase LipB [Pseudoclavibacter sp. VKM Ac-2867]
MMHVLTPGFEPTTVDYAEALALQRRLHAERVRGDRGDALVLLEHPSVYTAGRLTRRSERPSDGTPVVEVDRGGRLTWHGPGQLVGYPIVKLPEPIDVVAHVRRLEAALIELIAEFGVEGVQVAGRSGVWVDDDHGARKVAAIGVRVVEGCTMHGFALNCSNSLEPFSRIVPCGIADAGVTSLSAELGRPITPAEVAPRAAELLAAHLDVEAGVAA